jgi:hypothetical protein
MGRSKFIHGEDLGDISSRRDIDTSALVGFETARRGRRMKGCIQAKFYTVIGPVSLHIRLTELNVMSENATDCLKWGRQTCFCAGVMLFHVFPASFAA